MKNFKIILNEQEIELLEKLLTLQLVLNNPTTRAFLQEFQPLKGALTLINVGKRLIKQTEESLLNYLENEIKSDEIRASKKQKL